MRKQRKNYAAQENVALLRLHLVERQAVSDIREAMTERDIEIILQRVRETHPDAHPRIVSDNGSQFVAKDFLEFIRIAEMTHVRTSPYYPQSNGRIEWERCGDLRRAREPSGAQGRLTPREVGVDG